MNTPWIFFNRVPKADSTTFLDLVGELEAKGRVRHVHSTDFFDMDPRMTEGERLASACSDYVQAMTQR